MQKARRSRSSRVRPLVDTRFQGLFHSLIQGSFHLSLTVLVHYRSLRSIQPYQMVLADSDRISHVPPYSGYHYDFKIFRIRDYHSLWSSFPTYSTISYTQCRGPTTPNLPKQNWFGLLPVRSPLLRKSLLFSSPTPTQMFQFSAFASFDNQSSTRWVAPFRNLWIIRYLPLPKAYRSLSRLSSPLRAQAFPVCPQ